MQQLKMSLKEKLAREVQLTKAGFEICLTSLAAQESLTARMNDIGDFLSSESLCKVEKPKNHVAYLISGV